MSTLFNPINSSVMIYEKSSIYHGVTETGEILYRDSDLATVMNNIFSDYTNGLFLFLNLLGRHQISTSLTPDHNTRIEGAVVGDVAPAQRTGTILQADNSGNS